MVWQGASYAPPLIQQWCVERTLRLFYIVEQESADVHACQRTKHAALMAQSKRFHNSHIQHPMHILISNDDGYFAPGLICLAEHLARIADVVVVAPERDRSCASNSLTLDR